MLTTYFPTLFRNLIFKAQKDEHWPSHRDIFRFPIMAYGWYIGGGPYMRPPSMQSR